MTRIEHTATFTPFGKWVDVADGLASFALTDLPRDVYDQTVGQFEAMRRAGTRVLDLAISVSRDGDMIRATARGYTD